MNGCHAYRRERARARRQIEKRYVQVVCRRAVDGRLVGSGGDGRMVAFENEGHFN